MITLVSHGPEQNFIHPPRPTNPAVPWKQEYAVKARFVSRAGAVVGMEGMDGDESTARNSARGANPDCVPQDAADMMGAAMGRALGGLLGGGRKKPVPCPN
jgi:hypothetical protein